MTSTTEAVADRRSLANLIAKTALSAQLLAVPADFLTWAAALGAREYAASRLKGGEITAVVVGEVAGRPIRVTSVFKTVPAFMRPVVDSLPAFDSPKPPARVPFRGAA